MGRLPRLTRAEAAHLGELGAVVAPERPARGRTTPRRPAPPTIPATAQEDRPERVLGLDLAAQCTGYCLLVGGHPSAHGVFELPDRKRREPLAGWLGRWAAVLGEQVGILLALHAPDVVAWEYPDTYRRAWSGGSKGREFFVVQALGRVQGMLVALWPRIGGAIELVAVSTSDAKAAATGRVDANKEQVRYELWQRRRWDLVGWSLDETDAAAVALAAWEGVQG